MARVPLTETFSTLNETLILTNSGRWGRRRGGSWAPTSRAIVFAAEGWRMDGSRRAVKAPVLGRSEILAARFERSPPPDTVSFW